MKFELRHAHVVTTIARVGSISRAAVELSLPQPSLTTQLRRIERLVGGDLFLRTRRGVVPTPLGERVIPMLAELIAASDAVLAQAGQHGPVVVRLGLADWTPTSLRAALDEGLPGHEVETVTVPASRVLDDVEQGALGAAVVAAGMESGPREVAARGLVSVVVHREPVWVATSGTTDAASLRRHLADRPWVRYTAEHPLAAADRTTRRRFGISPGQVVHRAGSQAEAVAWVAETGAAAVVVPTGPLAGTTAVDPGDAPLTSLLLVHRADALPADVAGLLLGALRRHYVAAARRRPRLWRWVLTHQAHDVELADLVAQAEAEPSRIDLRRRGSQAQSSSAATREPISSPTTRPASLLTE